VALLLVVYVGFVSGTGATRGVLGVPVADGQNVRAAMLLTAAWLLVFAVPVLVVVPPPQDVSGSTPASVGVLGAYRKLLSDSAGEWRRDRNVVYYLLGSAVFRDGQSGVFAFGGARRQRLRDLAR
jgi:UMF1 family MFS transporter